MSLLYGGYPSASGKTNIKTAYTFINGSKKYFWKDKTIFDNFTQNNLYSPISYTDIYNNNIRIIYVENNTFKTKIIPFTANNTQNVQFIKDNVHFEYNNMYYYIQNSLINSTILSIDTTNIPKHNLISDSIFKYYTSPQGVYILECAPVSIRSSDLMIIYNYKYYLYFMDYDNPNVFNLISELSNYSDKSDSNMSSYNLYGTVIPNGYIINDIHNTNNIYILNKDKIVFTINPIIYNNITYKKYAIQGYYLYGLSNAKIACKNIITNEIIDYTSPVYSNIMESLGYIKYCYPNDQLFARSSQYSGIIKFNKNNNPIGISEMYSTMYGFKYYNQNTNSYNIYFKDNENNLVYYNDNLELINVGNSNLPIAVSPISNRFINNGTIIATASADGTNVYGSFGSATFTKIF